MLTTLSDNSSLFRRLCHRAIQFPANPELAIFLAAIWITLTCNTAYWSVLAKAAPGTGATSAVFLSSFFLLTVGLISITLLILSTVLTTRLTLTIGLLLAAAAGYFTTAFGTLIDDDMLRNVIETNQAEASELLSLRLSGTLLLTGLLPTVVIWRMRFKTRRVMAAVAQKAIALVIAVALLAIPLYAQQKEIFSAARNHHELRYMIAPLDVIAATVSLGKQDLSQPMPFRNIATDATHPSAIGITAKHTVHVLIVGETARAANFSLAGYDRTTNPMLEKRSDIYFGVAQACGTATAISVPCMFSVQDSAHFARAVSDNQDNLLDIAARAGYDVQWIDNGNSCKGVCARVNYLQVADHGDNRYCSGGDCFDDVLIGELRKLLSNVTSDTFVILHGLGSHGPLYYRRYPQDFRIFQPDCRSSNFGDCSAQEVINAYDNTLVYTDHMIASAIDLLNEYSNRFDVSLIYLSDHGESLGEKNLYLHGMPYRMAPREQTQVPFVVWPGQTLRTAMRDSSQCRPIAGTEKLSHDNLFHTELGLLGIVTKVYQRDLDLFSSCRAPAAGSNNS